MNAHPYLDLPDTSYWKRSISDAPMAELDPLITFPFTVDEKTKIATAGSCFAQHLARRLRSSGYNFLETEIAPFFMDEEMAYQNHYGIFSARYGNIYTCRQMLQLFQRAYGEFIPVEPEWTCAEGYVDPFRPRIQKGGFVSIKECQVDREQHFAAVRELFETLDVFVFTLGLSEGWSTMADGAMLPVCPGVAAGNFDSSHYRFMNLGVNDNTQDLLQFIDRLHSVNKQAKIILTVSPVPLVATFEARHVLVSNTYSKSVLRVVCEEVTNARDNVAYFPSYEIITGTYNKGAYFENNLRTVTSSGVDHVMRCFMKHCTTNKQLASETETLADTTVLSPDKNPFELTAQNLETLCDEEMLDARL